LTCGTDFALITAEPRSLMRRAFLICLVLLLPGAALAKGKASKGGKHSAAKATSAARPTARPASAKAAASAIAGALTNAERPAPTPQSQPAASAAPRGPQRIDFDDRLIEGQSNKSGAVYLYDRKDLQVDSMVKQPATFRSEIARGLFE
jgi:hypothetical protein